MVLVGGMTQDPSTNPAETIHPTRDQAKDVDFDQGEDTWRRPCGEACGRRLKARLRALRCRGSYGRKANGEGHVVKHKGFTRAGANIKESWRADRPMRTLFALGQTSLGGPLESVNVKDIVYPW